MRTRLRYNSWIAQVLGVSAITLYPFVFFAGAKASAELMRHELRHIEQIETVGVWRFYVSYLLYYFAGRVMGMSADDAYENICWEVDARNAEREGDTNG